MAIGIAVQRGLPLCASPADARRVAAHEPAERARFLLSNTRSSNVTPLSQAYRT